MNDNRRPIVQFNNFKVKGNAAGCANSVINTEGELTPGTQALARRAQDGQGPAPTADVKFGKGTVEGNAQGSVGLVLDVKKEKRSESQGNGGGEAPVAQMEEQGQSAAHIDSEDSSSKNGALSSNRRPSVVFDGVRVKGNVEGQANSVITTEGELTQGADELARRAQDGPGPAPNVDVEFRGGTVEGNAQGSVGLVLNVKKEEQSQSQGDGDGEAPVAQMEMRNPLEDQC